MEECFRKVARHLLPVSARALDFDINNITCSSNIVQQHKSPIGISLHLKLDSSSFDTRNSAKTNRHNPRFVLSNLQEHRHRQIEMLLWRIAPVSIRQKSNELQE
ncbi:hypothetical protein F8388_010156 [Cannabis sativa]|uniref:Uncharacterized protein n=1 Tax=Cannabis sativa TaxID=3483 RepID=A0A7J6GT93_CANSA|nr:hypothetical protein F8388_010156 [Cannabis sativa]